MDMILLTATDRAEIARLYVKHLGETYIGPDNVDICPTRAFIADLLRPSKPGWQVLTAEELLTCLRVTLHRPTELLTGLRIALAEAQKTTPPQSILPPYYTAELPFLDWLEDEKRGWPVLCEFLDYFNPLWFREYVNTLDEAAQAAEDADRQETHASMQGVAGKCNRGLTC